MLACSNCSWEGQHAEMSTIFCIKAACSAHYLAHLLQQHVVHHQNFMVWQQLPLV